MPRRIVLLGDPVEHSLSPVFQNAAIRAAGIDAFYEALRVPASSVASVLEQLRHHERGGAAGNVTVPHKELVASLCDSLTPVAARAGAVNTFWFSDVPDAWGERRSILVGDNTDVAGARSAIHDLMPPGLGGATCLIVGAGGSAAAVLLAAEAEDAGAIHLTSRTVERAEALVDRLKVAATVLPALPANLSRYDLVVNTTPVGLSGDEVPFSVATMHPGAAVFDLVYRREGTPLVRSARARGLRSTDGLGMLVSQGAHSFERWFGAWPDEKVMWQALEEGA